MSRLEALCVPRRGDASVRGAARPFRRHEILMQVGRQEVRVVRFLQCGDRVEDECDEAIGAVASRTSGCTLRYLGVPPRDVMPSSVRSMIDVDASENAADFLTTLGYVKKSEMVIEGDEYWSHHDGVVVRIFTVLRLRESGNVESAVPLDGAATPRSLKRAAAAAAAAVKMEREEEVVVDVDGDVDADADVMVTSGVGVGVGGGDDDGQWIVEVSTIASEPRRRHAASAVANFASSLAPIVEFSKMLDPLALR